MTTTIPPSLLSDCLATSAFAEPLPFDLDDARRAVLERVWRAMTEDHEADAILRSYVDSLAAGGLPPVDAHLSSFVVGLEPQDELPWLDRAALLSAAVLQFRQEVLDSTLPEEYRCGFGEPLAASPFGNLCSNCIVPGEEDGDDAQWRREPSNHLVVLYGGRAVAVEVLRDGVRANAASLVSAFRAIVADGAPAASQAWIGLLSTLEVREWSTVLRRLAATEGSRRAVRDLHSALFVVSLDHPVAERAAPLKDPGVRVHAGDPGNRWYNTATNLVVNDEGQAGFVFNFFAGVPGVPAVTFASYLFDRVIALQGELSQPSTPLARRACTLELTLAERSRLEERKRELSASQPLTDGTVEVDVAREDFRPIRNGWGCAMLAAFYYASRRSWGEDFALAFLLSVKALQQGALFIVPARLPAVRELVDAIESGEGRAALRSKLERAAANYGSLVRAAQSGLELHSLVRLLLSAVSVYATEEELALFPSQKVRHAHHAWASNIPDVKGVQHLGRFVPAPFANALWLHYRALQGRTQLVVQPGNGERDTCGDWCASAAATLRLLRDAVR